MKVYSANKRAGTIVGESLESVLQRIGVTEREAKQANPWLFEVSPDVEWCVSLEQVLP